MKTEFEKFISDSIQQFQPDIPDKDYLWEKIQPTKKNGISRLLCTKTGVAAVIIILVAVAGLLFVNYQPDHTQQFYTASLNEIETSEMFYNNLFDEKWEQIETLGEFDKDYFEPFYRELESIDQQYEEYKQNLQQFGLREDILRAMIQNQRKKLEVLETMILQIQKIKKYETVNKKV